MDKFNNLFFVDLDSSQISMIKRSDLQDRYGDDDNVSEQKEVYFAVKYDTVESKTVTNVQDVAIEQEYLYWTNDSHLDGHGGVHKAFTEPFIKAAPF